MPHRELERLLLVHRFLNLDIDKHAELQEIVELTAEFCEVPIALITLIDEDTRYFLYKKGVEKDENDLRDTFCQYLMDSPDAMIVPDALKDERFTDNPSVRAQPHVRFYAGSTLVTHDGISLGTICIMDVAPQQLSKAQHHLLSALSKRVIQILEFEFSIDILKNQFLKAKGAEIKLRYFFESSVACHLLFGREGLLLEFTCVCAL